MTETRSAAVDQTVPDDLISFLMAIPDGRYRRGVRYPQWFLLLVAVLGILSGCRSSRDLEAFARRHREALNQALDLDFKRWPSDATFLYLFKKAHLQEFGQVPQAWMVSQIPDGAEGLEQLVCDGKTLRGSAVAAEDGSHRFVAQGDGLCPRPWCGPRDTLWELSAKEAPEHIKENWPGSAGIVEVITDTLTAGGKRTVRRHLFLTSIRTTPDALLCLIRQRWSIENEWHWARDAQLGEDAHRYANRTGAPVFSFLRTVVMNLLRRGGYRSIRQGLRELAYDIKGILALGGVPMPAPTT